MTLTELNALEPEQAATVFGDCCGSAQWVLQMIDRRPFESTDGVLNAADEIWSSLDEKDWLEAFDHHPRIGEQRAAIGQRRQASNWSATEQAGIESADNDVIEDLADANREYEKRFGYIYIVCAAGKSAGELLSIARQRLDHRPEDEIKVAAGEQSRITRLRLEKLLNHPEAK